MKLHVNFIRSTNGQRDIACYVYEPEGEVRGIVQIAHGMCDYVENYALLAERLDLTAATVSFHLKKLADAGLVDSYRSQYYTMYMLRQERLNLSILELLREESDEAELQAQREAQYRQKVLDSFLEYGRLKSIPTQLTIH